MENHNFYLLLPLSNWTRAFNRYTQTYDKRHVPGTHYPDDTYVIPEQDGECWNYALGKTNNLVERIGIQGDRIVGVRAKLPVLPADADHDSNLMAARPNHKTGTGIGWRWPSPILPIEAVGFIDHHGNWNDTRHEHVSAAAFALDNQHLARWQDCAPRSLSVLPIAQACNASCSFCFSKSSISDLPRERHLSLGVVEYWARLAAGAGATRSVITGGGEPTLMRHQAMADLIGTLRQALPYTLLISNGAMIDTWHGQRKGKAHDILEQWRQAGLSRLALSRHGNHQAQDAQLMGLKVDTTTVCRIALDVGLPVREICVLQKGGVETPEDVKQHLERAARDGMDEICFKELYVASLSENPLAGAKENAYCETHQVPLSMVIQALGDLGFTQQGELPWGSPYFEGLAGGKTLRVAAYTEPSTGWERHNKLVRSWNLMSDGTCMASLEDPASRLSGQRQ